MDINIRADSVTIEGYVNAVERNSKPLTSRMGKFIERIRKGAFSNALKRADDVHVLLNHDWSRDLGSIKRGNLELKEDNIGLHARFTTDDPEVVDDARKGNLVGWSFGFADVPNGIERSIEDGMPVRTVKDMLLREVSILNRKKVPAYDGTLIMARSDEDVDFFADDFLDDLNIREEEVPEERADDEVAKQDNEHPEADKVIDYSVYEQMISEMKGV